MLHPSGMWLWQERERERERENCNAHMFKAMTELNIHHDCLYMNIYKKTSIYKAQTRKLKERERESKKVTVNPVMRRLKMVPCPVILFHHHLIVTYGLKLWENLVRRLACQPKRAKY